MKIYNSLTHKKEEFVSIQENYIKMYICGQTVYDYCHLGHARKAIVFDMVRRWFIASGYQVTFVENITDIDDKIINRARDNGEPIEALTNRFIQYMYEDFDALDIMRADFQPKATNYIPQMIDVIDSLINKGYAYQASNRDIYYSVRKFKHYGKLSGKNIDDLSIGERVKVDIHKKDPLDFVLWKSVKETEPHWPSKFGIGRPGWHIECSAMASEILGKTFDIHGGGHDLQFPHHENEIAQSEASNCCKLANFWMHNGFLNIDDEKMSKSLGNFNTLREVLKEYDSEVIRLFMLKTHYRSPLNFSYSSLDEAKHGLTRLYTSFRSFNPNLSNSLDWENHYAKSFKLAMNDDFNTPLAIGVLFEICNEININQSSILVSLLVQLANTLGLLKRSASDFLQAGTKLSVKEIEQLIKNRNEARANKDFSQADQIRNTLLSNGIILEDTNKATLWRKGDKLLK